MTPQEFKASILQLAIQGKLVSHHEDDKEVSVTTSFCGDTSDFFEIPEKWKWLSIKDVASVNTGLSFKKQDQRNSSNGTLRVLRGGNIGDDYRYHLYDDDIYVDFNQFQTKYIQLLEGDIITPSVTSIEKICKTGFIDCELPKTTAGGFVYIVRCLDKSIIDAKYLMYFIASTFNKEQCKPNIHKSGQAFYNLKKSGFIEQPICVPPIAEQKRIVAKIEELLPLIDRYEKAWSELEEFNKRFPVDMQKSILQTAIQGKLVPQFPEEEGTGEELYQQIQKEKQRLIKDGKIKKEKPLPEITEDEIPFDIPDTWVWARVLDVAYLNSGNQYQENENGSLYVKVADMNLPDNQTEIKISTRRADIPFKDLIPVNSIIFPKRGGAIATNKKRMVCKEPIGVDSNTMAITMISAEMLPYISKWFASIDLGKLATGTSVPQINNKDIYPLLIPIPPLAEQKRIVAKLEEILPLCEKLK